MISGLWSEEANQDTSARVWTTNTIKDEGVKDHANTDTNSHKARNNPAQISG
jgi:hypothetical protein